MEEVVILDAGAQYSGLIDGAIHAANVKSVIKPLETRIEDLAKYKAIIISGGPNSVYDKDAPEYDPRLFTLDKPILGICYGFQLLNYHHEGTVKKRDLRQDGVYRILTDSTELFEGLESSQQALLTHGDSIDRLAEQFEVTSTCGEIITSIRHKTKPFYGVQFHPEVEESTNGLHMFRNFLYNIAGLSASYTIASRKELAITQIKDKVGDKNVLLLISGGVDSTVTAALLNEAIPKEQLRMVHIDHGFMRKDESEQVEAMLTKYGFNLEVINKKREFYKATEGLLDPEAKRVAIGDEFLNIRELLLDNNTLLAMGTLRPDVIESASKHASEKAETIKTHHNSTARVEALRDNNQLLEPLITYHKDEVRALGEKLNLPEELIWRQPFPGPGLAIRILCQEKPYICNNFHDVRTKLGSYTSDNLAAMVLPIRTVGVQGDGRSYSYAVGLSGKKDWSRLKDIAKDITDKIHEVNRVVYMFGELNPHQTTSITSTSLTQEAINQLQDADAIVRNIIDEYDLNKILKQVPVISAPLNFGWENYRTIIIRPFITNKWMTGRAAIPGKDFPEEALEKMVKEIMRLPRIVKVAYDLTDKPPGTTEWE